MIQYALWEPGSATFAIEGTSYGKLSVVAQHQTDDGYIVAVKKKGGSVYTGGSLLHRPIYSPAKSLVYQLTPLGRKIETRNIWKMKKLLEWGSGRS